jgi:TonB family protein
MCTAVVCFSAVAQNSQSSATTPESQVRLGNQYLADKDYHQAMIWFRKAAEKGDAAAQNNIGWLYKNGWGVQQDYAEAATWYRKAADQDNAFAEQNLGGLYEQGLGVKQDYGEAMIWYRKAANQGNANAQVNVGWLYQNGWGLKQDYTEALTWYRRAANQGNAFAMNDIGCLYQEGLGVDRDYGAAMAWYSRAADQGHADAENNIGLLYRSGLADKQDYSKAMTWFLKAADHGLAKAQVNIAWLYEKGLGVGQDYGQAMAWYRKAADQGQSDGQTGVGWIYQNGFGVKQDYSQAMVWYEQAAQQGNALAQNNIGWLYQNGWGVKQDNAEALSWYRKAADKGNTLAKANLENLSRDASQGDQADGKTPSDASVGSASHKGDMPSAVMPNGIRAPRPILSPDPEYSEEARKAGFSGVALLGVTVGPDGRPHDVKVVAPLGKGLDEKAVDAVKTWTFEPGTKDGKPVAVQLMIEIEFRLDGLSGVGAVDVLDVPQSASLGSYLSPLIAEAGNCWNKATADKTHAPSINKGQVTVHFVLKKDGRIGGIEIASGSGDDRLDQDARDCISSLATGAPFPDDLGENSFKVRMQLLYKIGGATLNPAGPQVAAKSKEQFYMEIAGVLSRSAEWTVRGTGCADSACGTISPEGVYTAPDVLPKPPFVCVTATLAGANPLTASTIIALVDKN